MSHWLVNTDTRDETGPKFRTKREAIEYGRQHIFGIFFVWKPKKDPRKTSKMTTQGATP